MARGAIGVCCQKVSEAEVMVEGGVFGGVTAAPVAKKIYQAIQKREQSGEFPRGRSLAQQ